MHYQLRESDPDQDKSTFGTVMAVIATLVTFYLTYKLVQAEKKQFEAHEPKSSYFCNVWNWVDLLAIGPTSIVLLVTLFGLGSEIMEELRMIAAFSSFFLILNFFDWVRLFEETAFYVQLIGRTLTTII